MDKDSGSHIMAWKLDGGSTNSGGSRGYTPSDGTVVVGKKYNYYSSMVIDELLFFNEKLTDDQIGELYEQGYTKKTKTMNWSNYGDNST